MALAIIICKAWANGSVESQFIAYFLAMAAVAAWRWSNWDGYARRRELPAAVLRITVYHLPALWRLFLGMLSDTSGLGGSLPRTALTLCGRALVTTAT